MKDIEKCTLRIDRSTVEKCSTFTLDDILSSYFIRNNSVANYSSSPIAACKSTYVSDCFLTDCEFILQSEVAAVRVH